MKPTDVVGATPITRGPFVNRLFTILISTLITIMFQTARTECPRLWEHAMAIVQLDLLEVVFLTAAGIAAAMAYWVDSLSSGN